MVSDLSDLREYIPLDAHLRSHPQWWTNLDRLLHGVHLSPQVASLQLFTDASLVGWGAYLEPLGLMAAGHWSQQESFLHTTIWR